MSVTSIITRFTANLMVQVVMSISDRPITLSVELGTTANLDQGVPYELTKIVYKRGDIFNGDEPILIHGCNNRGVMGSGIAKQIRDKYPKAYTEYKDYSNKFKLELGLVLPVFCTNRIIINCITQDGYGKDGKRYVDYGAVETCIKEVSTIAENYRLKHVAMPKIGAGLGGGRWETIAEIIEANSTFQPVVYEL